jgi:hypothetical protein
MNVEDVKKVRTRRVNLQRQEKEGGQADFDRPLRNVLNWAVERSCCGS